MRYHYKFIEHKNISINTQIMPKEVLNNGAFVRFMILFVTCIQIDLYKKDDNIYVKPQRLILFYKLYGDGLKH